MVRRGRLDRVAADAQTVDVFEISLVHYYANPALHQPRRYRVQSCQNDFDTARRAARESALAKSSMPFVANRPGL